jgi:hypothetical protein
MRLYAKRVPECTFNQVRDRRPQDAHGGRQQMSICHRGNAGRPSAPIFVSGNLQNRRSESRFASNTFTASIIVSTARM